MLVPIGAGMLRVRFTFGLRGVDLDRERAPVGDAQRRFVALGQALARVAARLHADPVDDDIDVVLLRLLQLRHVGRFDESRPSTRKRT